MPLRTLTDNLSENSYTYIYAAAMVVCAWLVPVSFSYAETSAQPSQTPALVIPADEASGTPDSQPMPTLSAAAQDSNQGSLSGAFLSSYVAHSEGNLSQALRFLNDAYQRDPSNQQIAGQILILQITLGHMDEAIRLAKTLSQGDEHELIVDLLLAANDLKEGRDKAAAARLKAASSNSFDLIWLPLLLEWMEMSQAKTSHISANDIIEQEEKVPSFVHYHLALLNDLHGFEAKAREHYLEAISDLGRAPFRALLAYINLQARTGDVESIQQLLLDLKKIRPDMDTLLRAELPYLSQLTQPEALPTTRFVANREQGVSEVLLTMASMLYTLDISQDIPLYLQMAIHLKPDFPTAQLMLGNYFESLELWPEAIAQYESIRSTSPLYVKSAIRRMHVLEIQENETAANRLAAELTSSFPTSIEAWVAAGDLKRNRGKFSQAITHYDKAISLLNSNYQSQHWFLFFARGASYERLGKWVEAESNLRQARNLAPNQPKVLNYIGYMWLEQDKKIHEAVKLIEAAYKLSPHEPHIIDSMGWARFKTGELIEAIAYLERAAEMLPNDPTINEHLGDSYWHADRILEARYQWLRAKDFSEDDEQTARLEKKIADGLSTYSFHTPPLTAKPADNAALSNASETEPAAPISN